jgi:hypothetical protein
METLYQIGNIFFFLFHICLVLFNLFGWLIQSLRKWNLATLLLTAFSWFALGFFYGFGYCFLTDWHWLIREKLGLENPYRSYIQFLITTVFHIPITETVANVLTVTLFFLALLMSIITNLRRRTLKN